MKKVKFDLELARKGHQVCNGKGDTVVLYAMSNTKQVGIRLLCVTNPLQPPNEFYYSTDIDGVSDMGADFDLHCMTPQEPEEKTVIFTNNYDYIVRFNLEAAKAGKPVAFIDEEKYGKLKRIADYNLLFGDSVDKERVCLLAISEKPEIDHELVHFISLSTTDKVNAYSELKMVTEPPKYIAVFKNTNPVVNDMHLTNNRVYDIEDVEEFNIENSSPLPPASGYTFIGFFPINL